MKTIYNLELNTLQLQRVAELVTGNNKIPATRKQITGWLDKLVTKALAGRPDGPTELRNFVCPKCSKPIAISVPTAPAPSNGAAPPAIVERAKIAHDAMQELYEAAGRTAKALNDLAGAK